MKRGMKFTFLYQRREDLFSYSGGHEAPKIANVFDGRKPGRMNKVRPITGSRQIASRDGIPVYLLLVKIKEPSLTWPTRVSRDLTTRMVAR